jgi:hypothetical protein
MLQKFNNSIAVKFQSTIQENISTVMMPQNNFGKFASTLEMVIINAKILKMVNGSIRFTTKSTALLMDPSSQVLKQIILQKHQQVQLLIMRQTFIVGKQ